VPVFRAFFCRVILILLVTESSVASDKPFEGSLKVAAHSISDNKSNKSEMVVLTVDKQKLQANLITWPSDQSQVKSLLKFTVAIGKETGDKRTQGDNRTPEGIYLTQSVIPDSKLPAKYGPFAIPLDYPNPVDRLEGKTGYGIWLHGVIKDERVEEANVTEGCVAFYNADISRLTRWLKPHQGVVVIAEDASKVNQKSDVDSIVNATNEWASAWASRDIESYAGFYSTNFNFAGRGHEAYKNYKKRVFNSYKVMTVNIGNLRAVTHPKYAVSMMDQDFHGDSRFSSIGRKILYWVREDGKWKISREVYENRRLEFVKLNPSSDHEEGMQATAVDSKGASTSNSLPSRL